MRRLTPLAVLLAFLLVGYAQQQQEVPKRYGSHPSCEAYEPGPGDTLTSGEVEISLENNQIRVEPDPVRQYPQVGFIGWRSDSLDWKVVFTGKSPFKRRVSRFDGDAGEPAKGAGVREDAECTSYKYMVIVTPRGGGQPDTLDPDGEIIPY